MWEGNSLAKGSEHVKGLTNFSDSFKTDHIPHLFGYSGKKPLIYLDDIEALAMRNVVVPLASNLSLICDKDLLPVRV